MATSAPPIGAEPTDEQLFRRFRTTGDADAFAALVHRYERELFGYLRRYVANAETAEDVFQATFLQVHLKRETFDDARRFRPWLYAVATHQAIDAQRRSRRHRMAHLDEGRPGIDGRTTFSGGLSGREAAVDAGAEDEETRQWIAAAVAGLTEPQQSVLHLVYRKGVKYREAAERLGIPVGTVKSRLHNALAALGKSLQQHRLVPAADLMPCRVPAKK